MRFLVLVSPEETRSVPLSARTCPEPAGDRITIANSGANQTKREQGVAAMLTPMDLCARCGINDASLFDASSALYDWVLNAT